MMKPGTMKDHPQGQKALHVAQMDGITVPRMFPTEGLEFQMPMISPRLQEGKGRGGRRRGEGKGEGKWRGTGRGRACI